MMISVAPDEPAAARVGRKQSEPVLVRLSEVRQRPVQWLWPGRIPLGKITLLAGDPGMGKSFITLDLASRVTRGADWPDHSKGLAGPGSVVLLSAEDDLEDTICPRLQAAQADLTKIVSLTATRSAADGSAQPLSLARDLRSVRAALSATPDCKLLVIDPISAYMGEVDGNSNIDVRRLLFPLAQLAAAHGIAVVAVTHLNKKAVGKAIYRAMGSLAFVAVARAAWGVLPDPEQSDRRLFVPLKQNLGKTAKGMGFELSSREGCEMPIVQWGTAAVEKTIDELLGLSRTFSVEEQSYHDRLDYVTEWLREQLSSGPCERRFLFLHGTLAGFCDSQLYRAARKLGVEKIKKGNAPDSWEWRLRED